MGSVDLDVLQETALAMAQSAIQNAMDQAGLKPSQLADRMGRHRSFVTRMMSGRHNLTVKTFALAVGACGFRPQFGYGPLMPDAPPPAPSPMKVPPINIPIQPWSELFRESGQRCAALVQGSGDQCKSVALANGKCSDHGGSNARPTCTVSHTYRTTQAETQYAGEYHEVTGPCGRPMPCKMHNTKENA